MAKPKPTKKAAAKAAYDRATGDRPVSVRDVQEQSKQQRPVRGVHGRGDSGQAIGNRKPPNRRNTTTGQAIMSQASPVMREDYNTRTAQGQVLAEYRGSPGRGEGASYASTKGPPGTTVAQRRSINTKQAAEVREQLRTRRGKQQRASEPRPRKG